MNKRTEIEILRQQLELLTEDSKNTYPATNALSKNSKAKNYQYFIFRAKLDKFLGIEPRAGNEEVENEAEWRNAGKKSGKHTFT